MLSFSQIRFLSVTFVLSVLFTPLSSAPTAPSNLTVTNLRATSFTLKWAASTGAAGGIAGYDIARDGTYLGSTTARSFAVTGLVPLSTYSLTATARDRAGLASSPSTALTVTTPADTTRPTRPEALAASNLTTTSFTLTWTGSTDDVGVTAYTIYRAGVAVDSTTATTFEVSGLAPDKSHRLTIRAVDAAGNLSAASPRLVVRTLAHPPTTPDGLLAANLKATSFTLKWNPSSGGTGGIAGYDVYRDGSLIGSTARRSLAILGLAPLTSYQLTVASRDTTDRVSPLSAPLTVTTPADTTKPTTPSNLSAAAIASNSFLLAWSASTDNVGVAGYDVYRNGTLFGSTTAPALSISGLAPATTYSMKARARDIAGNVSPLSPVLPVTTSAILNAPPTVALTAPVHGATFTLPIALQLSANAIDPDGTIARVEFFDGPAKLGATTSPDTPPSTFGLPFTFNSPGLHTIVARAFDNRGATADSLPVQIRLLPSLPYLADFETAEGYQQGSLDNQLGWIVAAGMAQVVAGDAAHGEQGLVLQANASMTHAAREFGTTAGNPPVVFIDLAVKPAAGAEPQNGTMLDFGNVRLACMLDPPVDGEATPTGRFFAALDDGTGGQIWSPLPASFPLGAGHAALDWQRVSLRLDYATRTWDFYLNGQLVAADLGFRPDSGDRLAGMDFQGHASADSALDDLYAGTENPLFPDADRDGMDDAWEVAHGLSAELNDRNFDLDGDGLTNIQEFLLGIDPFATDSDQDELPDGYEMALGTDPANGDTDADGLPDGWELGHGFDPLSDADATADSDSDGLTTLQEFAAGSEPYDYYNGTLPIIVSLVPADGSLGPNDTLSVLITGATGQPLANAPVSFRSILGGHMLAATPDEAGDFNLTITTDASGIARVFLKPPVTNAP